MATKKKKVDYTIWVLGAAAVSLLGYVFKDDIKNFFKKDQENDILDLPETPVIENVVTNSGVTPISTNVTPGLNP